MANPHHRLTAAQTAITNGKEVTDPKVRAVMDALTNEKGVKDEVRAALALFLKPYHRTVLNALCLSKASLEEMFQATEIPHAVLSAYQEYMFDNTVFENLLDRKVWVEDQMGAIPANQVQILMAAMTAGPKYLVWLLTGRGSYTPAEVLRYMMNDSMMRSLAHRTAPLDSDIAKEAHNWARTAERLAKSVHQVDPQDNEEARKALFIALNHRDDTGNEDTTGIPAEKILH